MEFGTRSGDEQGVSAENEPLRRIGPYEIIEELQGGGMGRVYVARQIGLGRIVALKAIAVGPGTRPDLELRFLREAQTIARLRHPNIVAVHDSGRADGCIYFSMTYIEGGDLADRMRTGPLGMAESASLLRKVALALACAHREGVLHRDLKPSNILLDGSEPMLADFGLAAELEAGGDLTNATSILGTPHYLAPEAMRGGSAALSVASDLYALGVVLFELLTGRTPFAGAGPARLASLLAEADPPAPHLLAPAVPRDLETICLKCLERDPARRYASADALAEDLGRFLAGERVLARPPSSMYVFRKFARRHRVILGASGIVAGVLVAATAESAWLAIRATRAEKRAAAEAMASQAAERRAAAESAASREVTDFLENDLLAQASPDEQPNRDLPLRTALDRAASKIDGRFPDQPLVAATIEATLAVTYVSLGEYARAQPHFERALALRQRALGKPDAKSLELMDELATDLFDEGRNREAEAMEMRALDAMKRELGPESPTTLHAMNSIIEIYKGEGKLADAEAMAEKTLFLTRKTIGPEGTETRYAMSNLASIYFSEERLADSERLNVEALALQKKAEGEENPDTLTMMNNLASVYWDEGKLAEAEKLNLQILAIRRRVMGPEHPETLRSMHNLATTYAEEGRLQESAALEKEALDKRRRILGVEHLDTLSSANSLASVLVHQGKFPEAEALLAPNVAICRRVFGPDHYLTINMEGRLAMVYDREGKAPEAETAFREAFEACMRQAGPASPRTLLLQDRLGGVLLKEKKFGEAEPLFLDLYKVLAQPGLKPPANGAPNPGGVAAQLVQLYEAWGKPASADGWKARAR
jgi:tetratricopeptide (TPR) repeat protein